MSKAVRKVKKTMSPPNCLRFERQIASDSAATNLRRRALAKRLKGSGRVLADATPSIIPHTEESKK